MFMTNVMGMGMGNPGYGPLCGELERAYRQLAELSRDRSGVEDDARLEAVRERIRRCEGRLLVVSLGQAAPCDIKPGCP